MESKRINSDDTRSKGSVRAHMAVILLLSAALVGTVFFYRERLANLWKDVVGISRRSGRSAGTRERPDGEAAARGAGEALPGGEQGSSPRIVVDAGLAAERVKLAEQKLARMELGKAEALLKEAEQAGAGSEAVREYQRKLDLLRRLLELAGVHSDAPPVAHAPREFFLSDGGVLVGVPLPDGVFSRTGSIRVRAPTGVSVVLGPEQVRGTALVTRKKRMAMLAAEARGIDARGPTEHPLRNCLKGAAAYRLGLGKESFNFFVRAMETDGNVAEAFAEHLAGKLAYRALWEEAAGRLAFATMLCRKIIQRYPGTMQEETARELLARIAELQGKEAYESTVDVVVRGGRKAARRTRTSPAAEDAPAVDEGALVAAFTAKPVTTKVKANNPLIAKADKFFVEAITHYAKGRPGAPNSNEHLAQAARLFDQAIELYDKALTAEPSNTRLENRITDATRFAYHSRKMQTLSHFR